MDDLLPHMRERLAALEQEPADEGERYHAITLTADEGGRASMTMFTRWVGWQNRERRVELRESSPVGVGHARVWRLLGQRCSFVHSGEDLVLFLLAGGNGLVLRELAEAAFPELASPQPSYPLGRSGFVDRSVLQDGALTRAPTPKTRAAVMRRDGRRCRICGQRPDDDVNVVLHVHHIRPWAEGGMTDHRNLITLCHTCHAGLDPHFDRALFEYVDPPQQPEGEALEFERQVANYRRVSGHR